MRVPLRKPLIYRVCTKRVKSKLNYSANYPHHY